MSTCYTTISSCGEYQISRLCIPQIYQGDDEYIRLTFLDKQSIVLDLNLVKDIEIMIYGLQSDYYLEYKWPHDVLYKDIKILQSVNNSGDIVNKGKIEFYIPSVYTKNLVSGDLYASIRIKIPDVNSQDPDALDIITFSCIKIADVKFTQLNFKI